jgi:hypothetical protein
MAVAEQIIPKIKKVKIDDLIRDLRLYPRQDVDYATVGRFMDAMRSGAKFPPIKVCETTGRIIDGFHRYSAYQQLGIKEVDAIGAAPKGDAQFFLMAVEANNAHGIGYSPADQYKIVKMAMSLGLEREQISLAVALPIQKVAEMTRNVPSFKPEDHPKPIHAPQSATVRSHPATIRPIEPKTDAITSSGFLFYCNQVIRFMRSDLCDINDERILSKVRELESCVTSQLNPNKLKDLVCAKIKQGAATYADLSIELGIPEMQLKALVEELKATGRINETKRGGKGEAQRGSMSEVLVVNEAEGETQNPTPRDGRVSHPAIQAFKAATGYYPQKLLYDQVIETLGDFPNVTQLNQVFVAWVGRGYNPKNINWLEWYASGPPERNGNGKSKERESASTRNVRNIKESLDYLGGLQGDGREVDPESKARLLASGT